MTRSFPRHRRRWAAAAAVSGAVVAALIASTVAGSARADDLKDKKHKIEKKVEKAHEDLDESSQALKDATAELERSQQQLGQARAALATSRAELGAAQLLDQQMQDKLAEAQKRLAQARSDAEAGQDDLDDQSLVLRQMVVSSYQSGDPGLMGLSSVLRSQDPASVTGQLKSAQAVLDKESGVLDRLQASRVLLTVRQREVNAAKQEVADRRKEAAENLERKQSLEQLAEAAEAQVSEMVSLRARAKKLAESAKNADLKELKKQQAERDRIEEMIKNAASNGSGYNGPTTGNGWLDWPVPGSVTSPFGWRIHPIYGYRSLHDGIDIGVGCGVPIKAAQKGVVLEEYFQTAWGNRLIMDHGVKYGVGVATIYNHMSGYAVAVGDTVKKGQTIGYVGTTGWSTGCHLHFTVLENGTAVDPLKWL
ncbi:MAG: peptidoglycan DD-metalloendopeptidase family protein [Nocardioidaceae bacterium]